MFYVRCLSKSLSKIVNVNDVQKVQMRRLFYFQQKQLVPFRKSYRTAKKPKSVTMLPGDGIGPQLMEHVRDVFEHMEAPINFEIVEIKTIEDIETALNSVKKNKAAIKANIEPLEGFAEIGSVNVALRQGLDLFINLMECRPIPGVEAKHKNVDLVIIRQNTEGEYSMREHESVKGVVESLKIITRSNTKRLAEWAFQYAIKRNRKMITIVHKANIMKLSDGLFSETVKEVGKKYTDIKLNDIIVDNCCMQIVANPKQFDILILPNLYGMILMNVMCGMLGGPGLHAGELYGQRYALFEPATRNVARVLVGKNEANPVSMLMCGVKLLNHLGNKYHAQLLQKAIYKTIEKDEYRTKDIGGCNTSTDFTCKLKSNIDALR